MHVSDQDVNQLSGSSSRFGHLYGTRPQRIEGRGASPAKRPWKQKASRDLLSNSRRPLVNPSLSDEASPGKRVEETRPAALYLSAHALLALLAEIKHLFVVQRFFRCVVNIAVCQPP